LLVFLDHRVSVTVVDTYLQSSALDAIEHAGAIDDRKMLVSFLLREALSLLITPSRHQAGKFVVIHGRSSIWEDFAYGSDICHQKL
jgi:hypothetical protein